MLIVLVTLVALLVLASLLVNALAVRVVVAVRLAVQLAVQLELARYGLLLVAQLALNLRHALEVVAEQALALLAERCARLC